MGSISLTEGWGSLDNGELLHRTVSEGSLHCSRGKRKQKLFIEQISG